MLVQKQLVAGARVKRIELSDVRPLKDEIAGRHQVPARADRPDRGGILLPHQLAGDRLVGAHREHLHHILADRPLRDVVGVAVALTDNQSVAHRVDGQRDAAVLPADVDQPRPGAERRRSPARSPVRHDVELVGRIGGVHLARPPAGLRVVDDRIGGAERVHRNAARVVRDRLGRPDLLTRHVARGRHRRLDDRVDRLAGLPMPQIQQAVLAG